MPHDPTAQRKITESPKAAEWFRRYVALGTGRSLEKLAQQRVAQGYAKTVPTAMSQLKGWSARYQWQDRLAHAADAEADRMIQASARLDADTFLATSRLLNERIKWTDVGHLDAVVKMRESVRKPAPKGGAAVNVNVSVEVRQMAERLAGELGVDAEELIREAELIASGQWDSSS